MVDFFFSSNMIAMVAVAQMAFTLAHFAGLV